MSGPILQESLLPSMTTTKPTDFEEITALISVARQRAVQAVNTTLIELYW